MAESSFRLPSLLNVTDGNVTENFKKWKREFEVYMTATGSDKKDAKEIRDKDVNKVQQSTARPKKNTVRNKTSYQPQPQSQPCDYCGKLHAPKKEECPAWGAFVGEVEKDLGDLCEAKLYVEEDAKPVVLPARKIPIAIQGQVKQELDKLVERGILVPVKEPTEWVNQMAVVRKSSGCLRICLDPQPLNKVLERQQYRLTTFDKVVPNLNQAKLFTKMEVKEAFWHVRLDEESNDIIVVGCGETEQSAKSDNDRKLKSLAKRCSEQNIILNEEKTKFGKEVIFHGHRITDKGVLPDENKVKAIQNMPKPKNVTEVRQICELVQYMSKFLPDLASTMEPIHQLTRKDAKWEWTNECDESLEKVKEQITSAPVLADTRSVQDGVIFKGEKIVIPKCLRKEMLQRLHKAHLGYDSMDRRARGTIFWSGMRAELKEFTKKCVQCEDRKPPPQQEKLKQHSDGLGPWDKVGSDLFQIQNRLYLVVVDYHSSFIEVDFLTAATSQQVTDKMKKHFARFGIPRELITDGGPQYMSTEFCNFTQKWGIKHHITSPHHSASNGKAESAVKAIKTLIIKCHESRTDPMEAILEQRNTPRVDTKRSPAEMMMNRKLRTMATQQQPLNQNQQQLRNPA
ncbi:uncharacterized protein K02A2.6-like [Dreissena polymorpha]|uniref:uncharacterized protein K02A2.6-like n=1 Tax=Dreissena polymorpha TaxID=45954 RepID=UPI0022647729|nr:uncharacterized protein K02A2.6-like [Dreissena polymorpha]